MPLTIPEVSLLYYPRIGAKISHSAATVNGAVSANGDETKVRSISIITDYAGMQSLSNYQNATSKSAGSSSASASNVGILKRRKRQVAWLSVEILKRQTEHP